MSKCGHHSRPYGYWYGDEVRGKAVKVSESSLSDTIQDYELAKIIVSGSRHGVKTIIHVLYQLDFDQISEWRKFQKEPHSERFMRVLTRHVKKIDSTKCHELDIP